MRCVSSEAAAVVALAVFCALAPGGASAQEPIIPPGGVPEIGPPPGRANTPRDRAEVHREPPPPPVETPAYSVGIHLRVGFPFEASFDRALTALRYNGTRVSPIGLVGVAVPALDWLWLGARIGARGRSWAHRDHSDATIAAADLLLTAEVRIMAGRVVELTILLGGGIAVMVAQLQGVGTEQLWPRFTAELGMSFRVDDHFAIGPRGGWDYFEWVGMNAYDHGVDLGGLFFGLTLEGRE